MPKKKPTLHIISNSHTAAVMSGGERIAIELSRRWQSSLSIIVYTSRFGIDLWRTNNMNGVEYREISKAGSSVMGYAWRALKGALQAQRALGKESEKRCYVYSASDFWPDSLPAYTAKCRNPNIVWIAGFYLFAPPPFAEDSPYKGARRLVGAMYWLTQRPIYHLVKRSADIVFVTSEPDIARFETAKRGKDKIIVIRGGVDFKTASIYMIGNKVVVPEKRLYDACFVGRFHDQKGVLELIDIWKIVCDQNPDRQLVMIGIGPLLERVTRRVADLGLNNNIELPGYVDGAEKYEYFKQSKIVVHPATYDSGGMAACEAMAWGLPGVSFDLEALRTYYPIGMVKVPVGDLTGFAYAIDHLLTDVSFYEEKRNEAIDWASEWDWDKNATRILDDIKVICNQDI